MMKKYSAVLIFMLLMYHTKGQLSFSYAYVGCVYPENVINSNDNGFIAFGYTGIMKLDSVQRETPLTILFPLLNLILQVIQYGVVEFQFPKLQMFLQLSNHLILLY